MILLFDIDGTLLNVHSEIMTSIVDRSLEMVGLKDKVTVPKKFSGRTDTDIFYSYLSETEDQDIQFQRLKHAYLEQLADHLLPEHVTALPHSETLIPQIEQRNLHYGLMTGNFTETGHIKLQQAGLSPYLSIPELAIFGDQYRDRSDMAQTAHRRSCDYLKRELSPEDIIVIGDTPNDVRAAQAHGYRTIAVTTGSYTQDQFAEHQPDQFIDDLSHLMDVIDEWI